MCRSTCLRKRRGQGGPDDRSARRERQLRLREEAGIKLERTGSNLSRTSTHKFLREIGQDLWFSEGGSRTDTRPGFRNTEASQGREVSYYVDTLSTLGGTSAGKRIKRLYYYSFCPGDPLIFDSTLLTTPSAEFCGTGTRSAYSTFKTRSLRNPFG